VYTSLRDAAPKGAYTTTAAREGWSKLPPVNPPGLAAKNMEVCMHTVWEMTAKEDDGKAVYASLSPIGLAGWRLEFGIDTDRGQVVIGHKVGADRLALMTAAEGIAEQMLAASEIWRRA